MLSDLDIILDLENWIDVDVSPKPETKIRLANLYLTHFSTQLDIPRVIPEFL
jgi:hypothetical protein